MKKFIVAAAIAASSFGAVAPAQAQAQDLVAVCVADPAGCAAAIELAIAGLPAAEANAIIGSVAGGLVEAVQEDPSLSGDLGSALSDVADLSTDDAQQEALEAVAEAVTDGNADDVTIDPVGQSGN